jgi:hypothetical protein
LDDISGSRLEHENDQVGAGQHVQFGLTNSHRFDDDKILSKGDILLGIVKDSLRYEGFYACQPVYGASSSP